HLPLRPPIPIAFVFGSSPNESRGVAWKGSCREDDFESVCGVRDVFCQYIQNVVSAADKRLPHQAGSCVIEYPYPFRPIGENDTEGVPFSTVASPWAHMQVICRPTPPLCCLRLILSAPQFCSSCSARAHDRSWCIKTAKTP